MRLRRLEVSAELAAQLLRDGCAAFEPIERIADLRIVDAHWLNSSRGIVLAVESESFEDVSACRWSDLPPLTLTFRRMEAQPGPVDARHASEVLSAGTGGFELVEDPDDPDERHGEVPGA